MKHKNKQNTILAALNYLIEKQKLSEKEIQKLIIKTIKQNQ
jgi:hypothetical protein